MQNFLSRQLEQKSCHNDRRHYNTYFWSFLPSVCEPLISRHCLSSTPEQGNVLQLTQFWTVFIHLKSSVQSICFLPICQISNNSIVFSSCYVVANGWTPCFSWYSGHSSEWVLYEVIALLGRQVSTTTDIYGASFPSSLQSILKNLRF